jgi:hypothetical protein
MWIKKAVALTVSLAFLSSPALMAQQNVPVGNVMGFVYEEDGKTPFEDATVILKKVEAEEGDKEYKSEPTPETGEYRIDQIPVGRYRAVIRTGNGKLYTTLSAVNIVADKTVIRSFHLGPRRPFGAFIIWPCGVAAVVAGTALVIKIIREKEEDEVSPTER